MRRRFVETTTLPTILVIRNLRARGAKMSKSTMPLKKRRLEEARSIRSTKKIKLSREGIATQDDPTRVQTNSVLISEEVDFPRGGGTTLTPIEVKAIRIEAAKEADQELFAVSISS